jgi:hypothetical protein
MDRARKNRAAYSGFSTAKWQWQHVEATGRQSREREERPLYTPEQESPVQGNAEPIRNNTQRDERQFSAGV